MLAVISLSYRSPALWHPRPLYLVPGGLGERISSQLLPHLRICGGAETFGATTLHQRSEKVCWQDERVRVAGD